MPIQVNTIDRLYINLILINDPPALVFEYLFQLNRIFQAYLGPKYTEDHIRNNFTLIYELLEGNVHMF